MRYGFDATAAGAADQWLSKVNDIAMVVDLGSMQRLMTIKGKFDAANGASPVSDPELVFHDKLKPVIDILQILASLQTGDYKAAFEKGLDVAMSNSADSWTYALHARKEIPVVRFPPGLAYNVPTNPLKLEAHMAIGVYFNEAHADPQRSRPARAVGGRVPGVRWKPLGDVREPGGRHGVRRRDRSISSPQRTSRPGRHCT